MSLAAPSSAVVTGGSGFIGARVVQRLLAEGWRVYALGRAKDDLPWRVRMLAALDAISGMPVDRRLLGDLHCIEADLGQPFTRPALNPTPVGGALLLHIAGDTRFTASTTPEQADINIAAGPMLVQALRSAITRVLHISTAYVAGARDGWVRESEFDVGQSFRNGYESSKLAGELRMRETCQALGLPLVITRPSIAINDSTTGRSSSFTHLNALVEVVRRLRQHFNLAFGEVNRDRIRVPIQPDRHPNMLPVDVIVAALVRIAGAPEAGGKVYHLCHPQPPAFRDIAALIMDALAIGPKLTIVDTSEIEEPLTYTEKMVMRAFKPYLAYLNAGCTFELTNTRRLIPDYDALFSPLNVAYMNNVVAFHRASGWTGRSLDVDNLPELPTKE